ncbi:MAG: MotA/TolQ/ExbB proton channel family protein [Bacteroidetes bacterium]|nr:MotA/TolQ/ExbB proton channel family protein [Bacteroidota bacterium]
MLNSILLQVQLSTADQLKDATEAMPTHETLSLLNLAVKGGIVMIPLAILLIVAIYIFIERYFAIRRASNDETNFMNNIRDFIYDGRIDSAKALCKNNTSPISKMIAKGVVRIGRPLNDINAAIENVGKLEVAKLEKNIAFLSTVAGAAPMIGFLGTVIGMVRAFYNMSMAGNNIDISLLAGGIYEAMVTTIAGLVVGIIAYICYNILVSKIEKLIFILEARATEFMDLLHEPAS